MSPFSCIYLYQTKQLIMLFFIIALVAIISIAVYVTKKNKSITVPTAPIVKETPTMAAKPKTAKKKSTKKVDA